ncbi:hypothetical protein CLU83_1587 [Flavobacterium sp. 1]|uniref:hypothetical protein n=1 Tax=Flavobacterium sp. 1 TaxID=2035200 RepID=UPI000CB900A5|nr:hypothetical protein [Flavobacterium sp. 1]PJJ08327.1 hypothetical protein CLU83_1587 [Flavobacterium sp. 1]
MNRRDFLNAAGLVGISSAINSESVFGQTSYKNKMKPLKKIITIEEHFVLKKISQRVAEFTIPNEAKEKIAYRNAEKLLKLKV